MLRCGVRPHFHLPRRCWRQAGWTDQLSPITAIRPMIARPAAHLNITSRARKAGSSWYIFMQPLAVE
jgi:hypothetical protein